jgi:hypothetical protein
VTRVVGALLVREGSYAVQVRLVHRLLPGAQLEPVPLIEGDILKPLDLAMDVIALSILPGIPPWIKAFEVHEQ